jgi:TrmH family RNA methyltransferase
MKLILGSEHSMLTSTKNPRIRHIRKLQGSARTRRDEGLCVIEGVRLAEEALKADWSPNLVLHTADINPRGQEVVAGFKAKGADIQLVSPQVMQAASDTQTSQGILAVLQTKKPAIIEAPNFVVIADGLRDPGNLGTILRTALAAGADAVFLPSGGVDPFSPKVLRAGMGAHFRLPIFPMDWDAIETRLTGLNIFLADSVDGQTHFESNFEDPMAIIIGGEAQGSGSQAQKLATSRVHIPMPGKFESLNAAVAAAILMFEVARQRHLEETRP